MSRRNKWLRGCKRASMELTQSVSYFDCFENAVLYPAWAVMPSMNLEITLMSQQLFWAHNICPSFEDAHQKNRYPERHLRLLSSLVQDPALPGGLNAWSYAQSRGKAMYTTVCLSICYMPYFSDSCGHDQFGQQIMYVGVSQQGRG